MKGDKAICYWRGQCSDFKNYNPSLKWFPLINDLAVGDVKHGHEAGMIQMKLSINHPNENPEQDWE